MSERGHTEILASVAPLAKRYDAWLCDIWGVLHNGERAFAAAHEACTAFRREGGRVVLITNAPRPFASVAAQIGRLGVPASAYDAIVTSGDVTRGLVRGLADRPLYHLGPQRDRAVFEGLEARLAPAAMAEAVICTGLIDDLTETPDDYAEMLAGFRKRSLPLVCANPDLVVERGASVVYCAGALAAAYERLGGEVVYAGKPHRPIYEMAIAALQQAGGKPVDPSRVLAIGDGLKTDMAGAAAFGIDALFIPSGVHVEAGRGLDAALIEELFGKAGLGRPVAAVPRLVW